MIKPFFILLCLSSTAFGGVGLVGGTINGGSGSSGGSGGATNGIQQLNGFGTNTTITNITINGGIVNSLNGVGVTNLQYTNIVMSMLNSTYVMPPPLGNDLTGQIHNMMRPFATPYIAASNVHVFQAGATNIECIQITAGSYTNNNFGYPYMDIVCANRGVQLHFEPGPTDTNGYPFMGDITGHGTGPYIITGYPELFYSRGTNYFLNNTMQIGFGNDGYIWSVGVTNCQGAFVITNVNSSFIAEVGQIHYTDCFSTGGTTNNCACFNLINGTYTHIDFTTAYDSLFNGATMGQILATNIDTGDGNIPIYFQSQASFMQWGSGYAALDGDIIGPFANQNGFWANQGVVAVTNFNTEQHLYVNANEIDSYFYASGASTNSVSWITVNGILGNGNTSANFYGGKNYVTAKKMFGAIGVNGAANQNTINWVTTQKETGGATNNNGSGARNVWVNMSTTGGGLATLYLSSDQYEDVGMSAFGIMNNGGELHIKGGTMKTPILAVLHVSGTTYLEKGLSIDTSANGSTNGWPIEVEGVGLHILNSVITNNATTFSIYAPSAETVNVDGQLSGYLTFAPNVTMNYATNYGNWNGVFTSLSLAGGYLVGPDSSGKLVNKTLSSLETDLNGNGGFIANNSGVGTNATLKGATAFNSSDGGTTAPTLYFAGTGTNTGIFSPAGWNGTTILGSHTIMTGITNSTVNFSAQFADQTVYNTNSTTLLTLLLNLPSGGVSVGSVFRYVTSGAVTTLTVANGTVISGAAVTSLVANSTIAYQSVNGASLFIRIQ